MVSCNCWELPRVGAAVGAGVLPALLFVPVGALDALIQGVFVVGLTGFEPATP